MVRSIAIISSILLNSCHIISGFDIFDIAIFWICTGYICLQSLENVQTREIIDVVHKLCLCQASLLTAILDIITLPLFLMMISSSSFSSSSISSWWNEHPRQHHSHHHNHGPTFYLKFCVAYTFFRNFLTPWNIVKTQNNLQLIIIIIDTYTHIGLIKQIVSSQYQVKCWLLFSSYICSTIRGTGTFWHTQPGATYL